MIARLLGVPSEKKETEVKKIMIYDAITMFKNKDLIIEKTGTLVPTLEFDSVQNNKRLIATQNASEKYYPTRGVVTVGILMTIVGLLLFSPIKLPSIYRYVGGIGFFIMGISVIGSGLLNSRKNREVMTE
jgi:hypothetical protein